MERAPKASAYLYIFHALYEIFRVIAESITGNIVALIEPGARHFKGIRVERHHQLRVSDTPYVHFSSFFFIIKRDIPNPCRGIHY